MKSNLSENNRNAYETERVNCLFLALGTNLGRKKENMDAACRLIEQRIGKIVSRSADYVTDPVDFVSENQFLNGAIAVETSLPAMDILKLTQDIERELGRCQKSINGVHYDRPIDIDLLIYGDEIFHSEVLKLPHPHLHRRRFVLEPLCEIAPKLLHPILQLSMEDLLKRLNEAEIREVTPANELTRVQEEVNRLLPQLTAHAEPLNEASLKTIVDAPNVHLYLLYDEMNAVCGMATLAVDTLPTGKKAWIEDVVTDTACRGRGYGRQLVQHLVAEARRLGAKSVNLTSRPQREAANRLYRSCGFVLRETNVYKLPL